MADLVHASLADLLPRELPGIGEAIREGLKGQPRLPGLSLLRDEIDRGLRDNLGKVDLYAQFAAAFVWVQDLRSHRTDGAGVAAMTHLGAQSVSLGATPVLSVSLDGLPLPPLRIAYDVTASFAGAELHTLGGLLVALNPGPCRIVARLSCGKVDLHKPWTLLDFPLPLTILVNPGLKIP